MSRPWRVRREGSPAVYEYPSAAAVVAGVRDGVWDVADEARGPADRRWWPIADHPELADAVADLEPPPPPQPNDDHLDFNPLIDVCLVLLIFFILTTTYESLRRSIEIPDPSPDEKGSKAVVINPKQLADRAFRVNARMSGNDPVVTIEGTPAAVDELPKRFEEVVKRTGRREMILDAEGAVPWGVRVAILDAAKGAGVYNVLSRVKGK